MSADPTAHLNSFIKTQLAQMKIPSAALVESFNRIFPLKLSRSEPRLGDATDIVVSLTDAVS